MPDPIAVAAKDFFASPTGVCVYVEIHRVAIRVTFATPDSVGEARLGNSPDCQAAVRIATLGLEKHREALLPLFEKVARERDGAQRKDHSREPQP